MGGYGFGATKDYIACPCYEMAYTSAVFWQKEVSDKLLKNKFLVSV